MDKPVIFAIDDEPAVLSVMVRDLRQEYGREYRILRSDSGPAALEAMRELKLRGEALALVIVDQRMPGMTGVELLEQAIEIFPEARRALLTAYADTEAAIRAINTIKLDYYLSKPWSPPEEHLYPVVADLLEAWRAGYVPPFEGLRVIGHRWSVQSYELKDFLARNLVPYQWLDVEASEEARTLLELAELDGRQLPVVLLPTGEHMVQPTITELAEKVGHRVRAELPFYDLAVVGSGPAGLAAAVYGASEGLKTVLMERHSAGGQAGTSARIENYLGFPSGLSGGDLARRAVAQARRFGAELISPVEVVGLRAEDPYRVIQLSDGTEISCRALIIASGVAYRKLEAPGVAEFTGAGVYYGSAMTEALTCQDRQVYIVGGGNSAGQAAVYLAKYARMVTILVRGETLAATMSSYLIDQIHQTPNICVRTGCSVAEAHGSDHLESLTLVGNGAEGREEVPADALFVFIGAAPYTDWVGDQIARDGYGFILTGPDLLKDGRRPANWNLKRDPFWLETSLPGVFAAGDVRARSIKRVASATGEGAMAVHFVHQHLAGV